MGVVIRLGRSGRQGDHQDHRREIEARHDQEQRLRAGEVDNERPEQGEADREGRVQGDREDPVRGQELPARHEDGDHGRLGRGKERGDGRDDHVQDEDHDQAVADEEEQAEEDRPEEVRHDQDEPAIEPVDVDPGHGRQENRRHEEAQDQQADGRGRIGQRVDLDSQPIQDHVPADLGRGLGQPEGQERSVLEDLEAARVLVVDDDLDRFDEIRGVLVEDLVLGLGEQLRSVRDHGRTVSLGVGATAALRAGSPRSTNPAIRASRSGRASRTWRPQVWQRRPMSAPSRSTSHVSPPQGWARRRRTTSPSRITSGAWSATAHGRGRVGGRLLAR